MQTRFIAYDRLGGRRGQLPDVLEATIVPSKNELATLTMTYPRGSTWSKWFENEPEIAFEYWDDKDGEWVEPANARFRVVSNDFDYLEEVETRNYSLIGIGEALRGIYVYEANGLTVNEDGKVQFPKSTPGRMISHVWDSARSRGWKGFAKTFDAETDSAGKPWSSKLTLSYDNETSLDSMIMYLVRMGLLDFEWQGRTLHAYNPRTVLTRDETIGPNPLRFNLSGGPTGVDAAPESNDFENRATHVVVQGEEGLRWVFETGAVLPEGRREVFLSYSGVNDEGTALILAAPTIAKYSNSLKNTTRQFQLNDDTLRKPYANYRVGDWAMVEKEDGEWERMQIFQLSVLINMSSGVQGYVSLGDKIDSLLERLNEKVQRVSGGSVNEGTTPPKQSSLKPAAPTGLVVTSQTVSDYWGRPKSTIGVNFAHSGTDVNGAPIEIDRFDIQYRKGSGPWAPLFYLEDNAGTYSWLDAKDANGNSLTYSFRVCAVSNRGNYSSWSAPVTHTVSKDVVPPDTPFTPTVVADLGAIFVVTVQHKGADSSAMPSDYSHMVIQMARSESGPWFDREFVTPPMVSAFINGEGYVTRWFRAIAVDEEGNRSTPSGVVSATTKPLVDVDIILKEIDAGKTRIRNAGELALTDQLTLAKKLEASDKAISDANTALTGKGGLTERLVTAEDMLKDAGSLIYTTGQTLRQKLTASDTAISNATSSLTNLKDVTLPKLTTDLSSANKRITDAETDLTAAESILAEATSGLDALSKKVSPLESGLNLIKNTTIPALQKSVDGKTAILRKIAAPTDTDVEPAGTRWEVYNTLNPGGKLRETWRRTADGKSWIQDLLDPTYIPLLDIGQATFGTMSGGRIETKSLSTDALLVGDFTNLVDDPNCEGPGWIIAEDHDPYVLARPSLATGPKFVGGFIITARGKDTRVTNRNMFTVEADTELYFEANVANRTNSTFHYRIEWFDTELAPISYNDIGFAAREAGDMDWERKSSSVKPPVDARSGRLAMIIGTSATTGQVYVGEPIVRRKNTGNLIVNGSIVGNHIEAESVAAKVGQFVKADIGNLVVTGSSTLSDVVAKKIAADTATFQTVDAKNIFVTGTSSLNEVVAKRIAADTAEFLTLGVEQLTVTGTANMKTAVADKMFTNIFATNKLTANQVWIGQGGNMFPYDFTHESWTETATVTYSATGGMSGGSSMLIAASTEQVGAFFANSAALREKFAPVLIPGESYRVSIWVKATGTIPINSIRIFLRMFAPGSGTIVNPTPSYANNADKALAANTWHLVETIFEVPSGTATQLNLGVYTTATANLAMRFSDLAIQPAATPSLIVDGGILAKHITASEEMSAKLGKFLKVDVVDLVVTKSAQMPEATVKRLWGDILSYRQITTSQLAISPQNFMPDPMHQDAVTLALRAAKADGTWTTAKTDPDTAYTGGLLRQDNFSAGALVRFNPPEGDPDLRIPVTPGKKIIVEADYRYRGSNVDTAATNSMQIQAYWDTASKGYLQSQNGPMDTTIQGLGPTWRTITQEFTVPEGAAFVRLNLRVFNPRFSRTEVGRIIVREMSGNELIVDGAITTKKLTVTEDMTVALLKVHKVEAGEIDVNSLTADTGFVGSMRTKILTADVIKATMVAADAITSEHIKGDAITAKHTLTGPLFQTTATASRGVKISNTLKFRVYDDSGNLRVHLGSGTTDLIAVPELRTAPRGSKGVALINSWKEGQPAIVLSDAGSLSTGEPAIWVDTYKILNIQGLMTSGATYGLVNIKGQLSVGDYWENGSKNAAHLISNMDLFRADSGASQIYQDSSIVRLTRTGESRHVAVVGTQVYLQYQDKSLIVNGNGTYINGPFTVSGSKNFVMPHPFDPENRELVHGATESPVSGIEYWGNEVIGEDGTLGVVLPDYFESLAKPENRSVFVTVNGSLASWTDIVNGSFTVTGTPGARFSWLVKAERYGGDFETERAKEVPSVPDAAEPSWPYPRPEDRPIDDSVPTPTPIEG